MRIACSSPREPSTSTPPGNKSRASSPTSRPCSMTVMAVGSLVRVLAWQVHLRHDLASLAASFSAASSGSCTSQYSLLRHCTPATNLDFEIFIRRPVHRLELQQVFAPAVQAGETSRMHLSASRVNRRLFVLYITRPRGASSYSISRGAVPFCWNLSHTAA